MKNGLSLKIKLEQVGGVDMGREDITKNKKMQIYKKVKLRNLIMEKLWMSVSDYEVESKKWSWATLT